MARRSMIIFMMPFRAAAICHAFDFYVICRQRHAPLCRRDALRYANAAPMPLDVFALMLRYFHTI